MVSVDFGEPFPDYEAQPQEQRELRVGQIAGEFCDGIYEPVLQNVGWVDPTPDPAVEPRLDHSSQPGAVPDQCLAGCHRVAVRRTSDQPEVVVECVCRRRSRGHKV
jgi:hypothetical protein